ncbi:MAG: ribokinase, partial [Anaerolineales bacterium]
MANILVVGSINMDLVVRVPHSPKPGETVLGGDFETFPGGKGANQAVAAARMGGNVTMIGRVGNDNFGDTLIQGLLENDVKTTHVIKDSDAPTGIAMIAVAPDGENMIVVAPGANSKVSLEDISNTRELMRQSDLLLLQLECPLEIICAAVDLAKVYQVPVVLNPAPAQPLPKSLLGNVDYLTPNQTELTQLTDESDINRAINKIQGWGMENLIITLGPNGARVISGGLDKHLPAHEITAVDTTAAGDSFNGALAVALAEQKPLIEAVRYGMAA